MSRKVRIAIVTRTIECGGAETVMLNLGQYLKESGFDVEIVTTGRPGGWFDRISELGVTRRHINGRYQLHPVVHSYRVGRELAAGNYDVIILSNSERYAQAAINMLPNNVIVIPWIHSDEQDAYSKAFVNKDAWNVAVGVSPKVAETADDMAGSRPVLFIPNGVKMPIEAQWHIRKPWQQPLKLIFVGRIEERQKGVFSLPEIVKACWDCKLEVSLNVVGNGTDLDSLMDKTESMAIHGMIQFLGLLSPREVYREFLKSHIMLMPSFVEGLPTVALEAQACGCVPIVSRIEGITDIVVDDNQTGYLVEIGDIEGFVDKIGEIYSSPSKWSEMSKAGREKVIREFSIEAMGKHFIQLISDALDGQYPLAHPRRKYLAVNPIAFTWREHVPRSIHRLGLGNLARKIFSHRPY